MIVVTGATGHLGRLIVEALVERVGLDAVAASARKPDKAAALSAAGVRVRRGDFDDTTSLSHAFEGATQVLIVSSNARARGGDAIGQHRTAIDAARAAGARRILYTSHMAASAESAFPPMLDHAATEAMLADAGLPWISLRNGFYASSGVDLLREALKTGTAAAPADGPVAWTAHADLAEAAAVIATDESYPTGPTAPLTAAETLDLAALAALATELGRPVRREVVTDGAFRAAMVDGGAPAAAAAMLLGLYRAAHAGEFAPADPTLATLLGRAPTPMRDVMAARLA